MHILVDDIIYCSQVYNFYGDMSFNPINAQSRKLHFERVAKAKALAEAVEKAKEASRQLEEAKDYLATVLTEGVIVKHRAFGEGTVQGYSGTILSVFFPKVNETKKLGLTVAIGNGLMTLESEEATQKIKSFIPVLNNESKIPTDLARATEELQPYLEYLD